MCSFAHRDQRAMDADSGGLEDACSEPERDQELEDMLAWSKSQASLSAKLAECSKDSAALSEVPSQVATSSSEQAVIVEKGGIPSMCMH